jgi:hypothetical protein
MRDYLLVGIMPYGQDRRVRDLCCQFGLELMQSDAKLVKLGKMFA